MDQLLDQIFARKFDEFIPGASVDLAEGRITKGEAVTCILKHKPKATLDELQSLAGCCETTAISALRGPNHAA